MGNCFSGPPEETEMSDPPPSSNNRRASEEPVLRSSGHGSASASSRGPLVNANLENLTPDLSSSDTMTVTQTLLRASDISDNKTNASLQSANPNSVQDIASTSNAQDIASTSNAQDIASTSNAQDIASTSGAHGDLEEIELDSADDSEDELPNVEEPVNLAEEKDGCPICLEGYNAVEPKQNMKCGHHFHLPCILGWRERRNNCPVCGRDMVFDPPID